LPLEANLWEGAKCHWKQISGKAQSKTLKARRPAAKLTNYFFFEGRTVNDFTGYDVVPSFPQEME